MDEFKIIKNYGNFFIVHNDSNLTTIAMSHNILDAKLIVSALNNRGETPTANTGSPKLPPDIVELVLEEIFGNRYASGNGAKYVKQTIVIIERQLRQTAEGVITPHPDCYMFGGRGCQNVRLDAGK